MTAIDVVDDILFADSGYWIALITPDDELHEKAAAVQNSLTSQQIVTTHLILNEVLNPRSGTSERQRLATVQMVDRIKRDPRVHIEPQMPELFEDAFDYFHQRLDKEWSITDCASFLVMEQLGIWQALTGDHHFEQAGFFAMLR